MGLPRFHRDLRDHLISIAPDEGKNQVGANRLAKQAESTRSGSTLATIPIRI